MLDLEAVLEKAAALKADNDLDAMRGMAAGFLVASNEVMKKYPNSDDAPRELVDFIADVSAAALLVALSGD